MSLTDIPWGDIVQGGCGTVALYLAVQIRRMVLSIETRVERLENRVLKPSPRRPKAKKR